MHISYAFYWFWSQVLEGILGPDETEKEKEKLLLKHPWLGR
jgi:hypothetical protein